MFGRTSIMIAEVGMVRPNIEVMCMVKSLKFQYALSHGHCLVSLLFPDVFVICIGLKVMCTYTIVCCLLYIG